MTPHDDEFYIGYEPVLPPGIARWLRRTAWIAGPLVLGVAGVVLLSHARLADAWFEFGHAVEMRGELRRDPYPSLAIDGRRVWLVGQGKHGAEDALAAVDDGMAHVRGTRIARGEATMLELAEDSAIGAGGGAVSHGEAHPPVSAPGHGARMTRDDGAEVTLRGEIVDSKCFLGVMNPGAGTVHRDCAALCLRGGVPPMLLVRDATGDDALVLLVGRDGESMSRALASLAGQPVEVRGVLTRDDRGPVLAADALAYRRITR